MRLATATGELARLGFTEPGRAVATLAGLHAVLSHEQLTRIAELAGLTADPDVAVASIGDILTRDPSYAPLVGSDPGFASRVLAVLGGSCELAHGLVARPQDLKVLDTPPLRASADAIEADLAAAVGTDEDGVATNPAALDDLRHGYRRHLVRIAARDLTASDPLAELPSVAAELADLADAAVRAAVAIARRDVPGASQVRFAIVALGKAGAQELNYISDVDVLYVAEPGIGPDGEPLVSTQHALEIAARVAAATTRACSARTGAGSLWQIDPNLRPEGKSGPLVRSLAGMRNYYTRWAKNWEYQAMLKARPMAGDLALGQEFCDIVSPLVWQAAERPGFIAETQAMRRRVISMIPAKEARREIKLGEGGLRDTEFSVQLLQLVHGRADPRLRLRATLPALEQLVEHGYVGRSDGAQLADAYRFQRLLEHRVQLYRVRRTHLMPDDDVGLRRLARGVGMRDADHLLETWRGSTRTVQRLHQRVFYSPLLEAVARMSSDEIRLTPEAARTRLRALGYADPAAALRHIEALSTGMSRQAEIQRQLLPAMLGWFAQGPNPDHGLLAFRQVSEELGATPWYLRALRDEGAMASRMAKLLSTSRYAVALLRRSPQAVELLAHDDTIVPRTGDSLRAEMASLLARHGHPDKASEAIRTARRRELLRIAMADILQGADLQTVGRGLSAITDTTIDATLDVIMRESTDAPRICLIAMGRWGGQEMAYASDADVLFVVEDSDDPESMKQATQLVAQLRALLRVSGPEPPLEMDADLRPEGKSGPLLRTLSSYLAYYDRWAATWEAQALLRARHGAGDPHLSDVLLAAADRLRYPEGGLTRQQVVDIRRLKARMEAQRIPKGTDPSRHVKLGPGGLSDVEWTVQLLQLQHAYEIPALRTTSTLPALEACRDAGLMSVADAATLAESWTLASRIRNSAMLIRARPSDVVPGDSTDAAQVAQTLGYEREAASHLLDDWRRVGRRARGVADRLFWGLG